MAIAHSLVALPAGAPAEERRSTFGECPRCGTCEDSRRHCPRDGTALVAHPFSRVLAGRYRLEQRIGRGGMGTVYDTYDTALDRRVAAKLLREDLVDTIGGAGERFTAEARIAAALIHPNVATIHDIGVTSCGRAFFIMELLHGVTLREELRRLGRLPADRARVLLAGVCAAVDAAHRRNILHRDLKPENIFICRGGAGETVKVLDFGLAKPLDTIAGGAIARSGLVAGTPCYMSPEHLGGDAPSPDWDLWAIAAVAFEMIEGRPPAPGLGGRATEGLPLSLRPLFVRALSPNPVERPESAQEFLEAFDAAVEAHHELSA
jgi:eukaryotic-like serine/threonine-protein kinase